MKISRLKNKKFIRLSKDFLLILAILDKISKKLKTAKKWLKIAKFRQSLNSKIVEIKEPASKLRRKGGGD